MSQTLISFLGRVPKTENGYRPTTYTFNSEPDEPTAFIGWTLHRRLKPDRLVILGTTGSMWDHLFEKDFVLGEEAENERLLLQEATEKKEVTTTPVSYTHLDVYKRQGYLKRSSDRDHVWNRTRYIPSLLFRGLRHLSAPTRDRTSNRPGSVSYTHLDVYKRQP